MTERIRVTVAITPEVHAVFLDMAKAEGASLSRTMGNWLADTAEGAQFVALKMREARLAPKTVMREFQQMARGLVEEVDADVERIRKMALTPGKTAQAQRDGSPGVRVPPRPVIRGGKYPEETLMTRGFKSVSAKGRQVKKAKS